MVTISLLPIGLAQAWAAMDRGTWYARSPEFLRHGALEVLRWLRIPGDTIFAFGALAIGWFMLGLLTGRSALASGPEGEPGTPPAPGELVDAGRRNG